VEGKASKFFNERGGEALKRRNFLRRKNRAARIPTSRGRKRDEKQLIRVLQKGGIKAGKIESKAPFTGKRRNS